VRRDEASIVLRREPLLAAGEGGSLRGWQWSWPVPMGAAIGTAYAVGRGGAGGSGQGWGGAGAGRGRGGITYRTFRVRRCRCFIALLVPHSLHNDAISSSESERMMCVSSVVCQCRPFKHRDRIEKALTNNFFSSIPCQAPPAARWCSCATRAAARTPPAWCSR
jgi:hypothetical protein